MKKPIIVLGAIVVALALISAALYFSSKKEGSSSPQYIFDSYGEGLALVELTPLPASTTARALRTTQGEEALTVLRGYRALYSYPEKYALVRLLVEQSDAEHFSDNQAILDRQFQYLQEVSATSSAYIYEKGGHLGTEYFIVGNPARLDGNVQTLEIASLFFPKDSTIVTLHFLNQGPEPTQKNFETSDDYKKFREEFITWYIERLVAV